MTWFHIKFATVSGKPDEYVRADSIETVQEFLYNYYANSSSFAITKEDINNIKYKPIDVSKSEINNMIKDNILVSRAIDLTENGTVYKPQSTKEEYNIFRKN